MQQLIDVLWVEQIAQPMLAQVPQFHAGRKGATGKLLHRLGEEDLPAVTRREEPREAVQRRSKVVTVLVRRGIIASAALRAPGPRLTPETRAEVDVLLERLARRDAAVRL